MPRLGRDTVFGNRATTLILKTKLELMGTVLALVRGGKEGGGVAAARLFHQLHPQYSPRCLETIWWRASGCRQLNELIYGGGLIKKALSRIGGVCESRGNCLTVTTSDAAMLSCCRSLVVIWNAAKGHMVLFCSRDIATALRSESYYTLS